MEKITKERARRILIEDGTEEYFIYKTSDGIEFDLEIDAQRHEKEIKFENIKKFEDNIPTTRCWYKAKNEEELEILKDILGFYSTYDEVHIRGELRVGEWFEAHHFDGGDYKGDNYFITLEEYKKCIDEFLWAMK
jgi:hypothetical protein